jgi:hypothetical protein
VSASNNVYLSLQVEEGNCPHWSKLGPAEEKELHALVRPQLSGSPCVEKEIQIGFA